MRAVWKELEKENKEFFKSYKEKMSQSKEDKRLSEEEIKRILQNIILDSPEKSSDD